MGFELLVTSYFEFIHALATKRSFAELIARNYRSLLPAAFGFAQLSHAQCETFMSDPNEFVAAEDDELSSYSVRNTVVELIQRLVDVYKRECIEGLVSAAQNRLREAEERKVWQLRESCLFILGSVAKQLRKFPDLLPPTRSIFL